MTVTYFILYLASVVVLYVASKTLKGRMQRWSKKMLKIATLALVKE